MRNDAPFVVKRYAPAIGRPDSPRRITIEHHAYSLSEAIAVAIERGTGRRRVLARMLEAGGDSEDWIEDTIAWLDRSARWIEHRSAPAVLRRGRAP